MTGWRKWVAIVAGLVLAGVIVGALPAWAQQYSAPVRVQTEGPAATPATFSQAEPNTSPFSLLLGANWASAYYWRGFVQTQNGGNNVQPYLELGWKLLEDAGPLSSLIIAPGVWTNWTDGGGCDTTSALSGLCRGDAFWESTDPYFKITATWWKVLSMTASYTYYTSPDSFSSNVNEFGLSFSLNDAKWLGPFALNPNLLFAFDFETDDPTRIYMGIGLAPGYTFFERSRFPVNVSLPMTFGFSVKDFYAFRTFVPLGCPSSGRPSFGFCVSREEQNEVFGYFSGGPLISVPFKFIPANFGNWTLQAGVQFLKLNSGLAALNRGPFGTTNGNSSFVPIGSVGLSLTY